MSLLDPAFPHRTQALPWLAAAVTTAVVLLAVLLVHLGVASQSSRALNAQLSARLAAENSASSRDRSPPSDFVATLPASFDVPSLFLDVKKSALEHGVTIASLSAARQPASPQRLGRVDVAATLKGDYPAVKRVLADVLERFPNVVLQHAQWRRQGAPNDLEAALDFSVLEAPAAPAAERGTAP